MVTFYLKDGLSPEFFPTRAYKDDTGLDVRTTQDITLEPLERALVGTGVKAGITQPNVEIQVRSRSGNALKHGVVVLNSPGTIDPGYKGEIKVILANLSNKPVSFKAGDRIAQLVVATFIEDGWIENDRDRWNDTEVAGNVLAGRGAGGFGSTGN